MEFYNKDEIQTGFAEESLYSSPEQKKGNGISKKSDIYSVGLVLYEMCKCYSDEDKRNKGIKHLKKHKILDDKFKRDYGLQSNLILQMIEDDEDKRPSCLELLEDKDMQNWKFIVNEN
jgi:serine/threonine protein kinase